MNNLILNILPIFVIATPCVAIDITSFKRIPHSGHGEAVLKEKALRTSITAEQRRDVPTQPAEVNEAKQVKERNANGSRAERSSPSTAPPPRN